MPNFHDCLAQAPVFSKLSEQERESLVARAHEKKYGKDENVFWQGEAWPHVAFIALERLARLLLRHYKPVDGQPAPRNLTLDQMADTVGTTRRELVRRTLHRFADERPIRVNRVEFAFRDRCKLGSLARGVDR